MALTQLLVRPLRSRLVVDGHFSFGKSCLQTPPFVPHPVAVAVKSGSTSSVA